MSYMGAKDVGSLARKKKSEAVDEVPTYTESGELAEGSLSATETSDDFLAEMAKPGDIPTVPTYTEGGELASGSFAPGPGSAKPPAVWRSGPEGTAMAAEGDVPSANPYKGELDSMATQTEKMWEQETPKQDKPSGKRPQATDIPKPPPADEPLVMGGVTTEEIGGKKPPSKSDISAFDQMMKRFKSMEVQRGISDEKDREYFNKRERDWQKRYDKAKEQKASARLWETVARGIGKIAAGVAGFNMGVDLSGMEFDKTDWGKEMELLQKEYDAEMDRLNKEKDRRAKAGERKERLQLAGIQAAQTAQSQEDIKRHRKAQTDISERQVGVAEDRLQELKDQNDVMNKLRRDQHISDVQYKKWQKDYKEKELGLRQEIAGQQHEVGMANVAARKEQATATRALAEKKFKAKGETDTAKALAKLQADDEKFILKSMLAAQKEDGKISGNADTVRMHVANAKRRAIQAGMSKEEADLRFTWTPNWVQENFFGMDPGGLKDPADIDIDDVLARARAGRAGETVPPSEELIAQRQEATPEKDAVAKQTKYPKTPGKTWVRLPSGAEVEKDDSIVADFEAKGLKLVRLN